MQIKRDKKIEKENQNYLYSPKNIIVVDQASVSTGYTIIKNGKIVDYGYIFIQSFNLVERLNYIKNKIIDLCKQHNIDSIVLEHLPFKGAKKVIFVLAQMRILLLDYAYENKMQYICIDPLAWENFGNKGRWQELDTKDRSLMTAKVDYEIDFKSKFCGLNKKEKNKKVWEDVCDSFLMAQYVIHKKLK